MIFLHAFAIVLCFSFAGEVCNRLIPLPVPASVWGMGLLFAGLLTGLVKKEWVKPASSFLIEIMPMLFIPAVAALPAVWPQLQPVILPVTAIALLTTLGVMAACGHAAQWALKKERRQPHD